MKKYLYIIFLFVPFLFNECTAGDPTDTSDKGTSKGVVVQLTKESFKKLVFDYETNKVWKFEGNKPAVIDFYADWCPPCRQLSPLVEEAAKEFAGKIDVYKVNTDNENILARELGITNLPTLLFIPANGKPQITMGAIPKDSLNKAINDILLIN